MTLTPTRILVAVDDSPASLAGVHLALELARHLDASVRFVHVLADGEVLRALRALHHDGTLVERRERGVELLLGHVEVEAQRAGVPSVGVSLEGEPGQVLLAETRAWQADLLVVGRADVGRPGTAYVGEVARQLLEFSELPVLVVPPPATAVRPR